jgi:hypothetical protein
MSMVFLGALTAILGLIAVGVLLTALLVKGTSLTLATAVTSVVMFLVTVLSLRTSATVRSIVIASVKSPNRETRVTIRSDSEGRKTVTTSEATR